MNIPVCPILQDTLQIQGHSHDLARSLRKLRRDLLTCQKCANYDNCQVLKEFNSQVQAAIDEVTAEWDQSITVP